MADHQQHIAVIGAGWAGCRAAVSLVKDGHRVSLFEAAPQAGGRARSVTVQQQTLDNGQHILLGAYRDTLQLIRSLGGDPAQLFLRLPLQMVYPPACDGMSLIAPKLPAPLHMAIGLLKASGLTLADKLALAKPDAIVMHPGPINRGREISSEVADSQRSAILNQVENGISVRMAVLERVLNARN